jgi:hypothetical protein
MVDANKPLTKGKFCNIIFVRRIIMPRCATCGSTDSDGWVLSNGTYYCSSGCQHNKETLANYRGKSGILSGLSQISDGAFSRGGISFDNIVGGAGKVVLGLGKLAGKGIGSLFKK